MAKIIDFGTYLPFAVRLANGGFQSTIATLTMARNAKDRPLPAGQVWAAQP